MDYNDGLVLPFAIDRSVLVAWARTGDPRIRAYSVDYGECYEVASGLLTEPAAGHRVGWASYVEAVARAVASEGHAIAGIDVVIGGDIPRAAGLSSSAALEVAVAGALRDAFSLPIRDVDLALLCQRAENEYVGVQSGIMDQFASALCHEDHALLIDCRSRQTRNVPLRLAEHGLAIVVANSAVPRELVASAFNERRRECEQAVVELRRVLDRADLASLRDVALSDVESIDTTDVASHTPLRRVRHVVAEIARVACAVEALERSDFDEAGRLMRESHQSLREDYDVSSPELDLLCALADAQDYVLGARLTGAGFGGCTVNLVRADSIGAFGRDVIEPYRTQTGLPAEAHPTSARAGLHGWLL